MAPLNLYIKECECVFICHRDQSLEILNLQLSLKLYFLKNMHFASQQTT